jgi:hypothetical protein
VVVGVGQLGTWRRAKEGSRECGAERWRRGCVLWGRGGGGEEGRQPAMVEFYSSSVSNELKGEKETGRHRFSGGSEGGMTTLQFGSLRVEEGGSRRRTARRHGQRGDGADGSRSWEPMEAGGGNRLGWRGCCDWADAEENKGNGLGREKGFRAKIIKRIGWL